MGQCSVLKLSRAGTDRQQGRDAVRASLGHTVCITNATSLLLFKCQGKCSSYIGSMFYFNLFNLVGCGNPFKKKSIVSSKFL